MKRKLYAWILSFCFAFPHLNNFVLAEEEPKEPETEEITEETMYEEEPESEEISEEHPEETAFPDTEEYPAVIEENENPSETDEEAIIPSAEKSDEEEYSEQINESAEKPEDSYSEADPGSFSYSISNEKVTIKQYTGSESEVEIPSVIEGYPVTRIADNAFTGNTAVARITIPESVTMIGNYVFSECSGLTDLTIPSSVTTIGHHVFSGCSGLKSAGPIGSSADYKFGWTDTIPAYAFSFSAITDITIPDGVTSIGNAVFLSCTELTNVVIPEGVKRLSNNLFQGCSSLAYVRVPSTVTAVGEYAFSGCNSLQTAGPIGSGANYEFGWTETIAASAFRGLQSLTDVTLPDGIKQIEDNAFSGCSLLSSVTIPSGVKSIGESAFQNCRNMTHISVPESITSIGSSAFKNCEKIVSAGPIGSGADYEFGWTTSIPAYAFCQCTNMTNVEIPYSVLSIGDYAFAGCPELADISLSGELTTIGTGVFSACTGLTGISLPDNVTSIGGSAFYGCTGLTEITIPSKVTMINEKTFENCPALTEVVLPSNLKIIDQKAFRLCYELTSINLPEGLISINNEAFYSCSNLTSVTLPKSLTSIGIDAFCATSLTDITIPDNVTDIGAGAFERNNDLISVDLPKRLKSIPAHMFSKTGLTDIIIPESVTSIQSGAFYQCSNLEFIVFPETLSSVGAEAFKNCTCLKTVYFCGNQEQWNNIGIEADNDPLANADIRFCRLVSALIFDQNPIYIRLGETDVNMPAFLPEDATDFDLVWESEDPQTVSVDTEGTMTAVQKGHATIDVFDRISKKSAVFSVIVDDYAESIALNKNELTIYTGDTEQLEFAILPDDIVDDSVIWASNHPDIVMIDQNGLLTPLSNGEAEITAETINHKQARCTVTVLTHVSSVELDHTELELKALEQASLKAAVLPDSASNKDVMWSSSDNSIVSVDENGQLHAHKKGEAVITVTSADGEKKAECSVTVSYADPVMIEMDSAYYICQEESYPIDAYVLPLEANQNVVYSYRNGDGNIIVYQNGTMRGYARGKSALIISTPDKSVQRTADVYVLDPEKKENCELVVDDLKRYGRTNTDPNQFMGCTKYYLETISGVETFVGLSADETRIIIGDSGKNDTISMQTYLVYNIKTQMAEYSYIKFVSGNITVEGTDDNVNAKQMTRLTDFNFSLRANISLNESTAAQMKSNFNTSMKAMMQNADYVLLANARFNLNDIGFSYYTNPKYNYLNKITLAEKEITIHVGDTGHLEYTISPNKPDVLMNVEWSSSDPGVLSIGKVNGVYTANQTGDAVITVRTMESNKKDTCIVHIVDKAKPLQNLSLNITNKELSTLEKLTLVPAFTPEDADNKELIWSSDNEKAAAVDDNGVVTAKTYGKAVITAESAENPGVKATCTIQTRFYDVNDSTQSYYKPVYWGADNGVVAGFNGGEYFGPNDSCTRAQFVTFLWRLAGKPTGTKDVSFPDVDPKANYFRAVKWAVSEGIIVGFKHDNAPATFEPDGLVTRGQTATMLWRYGGRKTPKTGANFKDVKSTDSIYRAVSWGQEVGIIKGYKSGEFAGQFRPDDSCLRQHIVTFLYRYARDVLQRDMN